MQKPVPQSGLGLEKSMTKLFIFPTRFPMTLLRIRLRFWTTNRTAFCRVILFQFSKTHRCHTTNPTTTIEEDFQNDVPQQDLHGMLR